MNTTEPTVDNSPSYGELVSLLKRSLSQIYELERQLDLPGKNSVVLGKKQLHR